jgi:hypothetical protein
VGDIELVGSAIQNHNYSLEEVEAGLLELACSRGNSRRASAALAERGIKIPWRTLYDWKRKHVDRLDELEEQILPEIRKRLARDQEAIASQAARATLKLIQRVEQKADKIEARDLPGAVRNMEVTSATAIDKHSVLHGLPSEIRQTDSAEDILKRMQQKHPGMFIDSTAEEIPEAEVVEEKPRRGAERELSRTSAHSNAPSS